VGVERFQCQLFLGGKSALSPCRLGYADELLRSPHNMLPCLQGALSRSPSPALMVTEMRTLFQALRCLVRARRMQMVRSPSRRRMSGAAMCTKLREQIPFAPMLSTCLCSEQENLSISLLSQEIEYHLFVIVAS
jgi:hypothetical protein